jgi:protein-S-isoprenylcysteine O-methyltransferase Ste14
LVTNGIYGYIRHPIYTGVLLMALGTLIFSQTLLMLLFFLFMLIFFIFKLTQEEKLLTKHFSKEYPEYKKHTKALIPFIV